VNIGYHRYDASDNNDYEFNPINNQISESVMISNSYSFPYVSGCLSSLSWSARLGIYSADIC